MLKVLCQYWEAILEGGLDFQAYEIIIVKSLETFDLSWDNNYDESATTQNWAS